MEKIMYRPWLKKIHDNKLLNLFERGLLSLKKNGIKMTTRIVVDFTKKRWQDRFDHTPNIKRIVFWDITLHAIPSFVDESGKVRVNLVTDSIEKKYLFGGVATVLIIATEFANKYELSLRIITRTTPVDPLDYKKIISLNGIKEPEDVSFFFTEYHRDINCKKDLRLGISKNDIFIATSWWSAAAINNTIPGKQFFYIIQEAETFFYPHGDEHYLCSQVMHQSNINYIVNSKYLFDYFKESEPNITNNGIYFHPAFSRNLYQNSNIIEKSKYKLFFYSRSNNQRNLFYRGVYLLDKAFEKGILDPKEWDVYFAGNYEYQVIFNNGYKAINMGILDWERYSHFLQDIDLGVSLMYTPHPSYPPYDVACSGGVVVSNKCLNKKEIYECKNILLSDLEEDSFLETMKKGVALVKDIEQRRKNFEESTIPRSWPDTIKDVLLFMEEKSNNVILQNG